MTPRGTLVSAEDPSCTFALPYKPLALRPTGNVGAKLEKVFPIPESATQVESRVYFVPVQVVHVLSSTKVYSDVVLNAHFIS